jgi:hypothetical protein
MAPKKGDVLDVFGIEGFHGTAVLVGQVEKEQGIPAGMP